MERYFRTNPRVFARERFPNNQIFGTIDSSHLTSGEFVKGREDARR